MGWFGRLNFQKDPLTFLRAASDVLRSASDVRFVVCGDDPLDEGLTDAVHRLAKELGIEDRIQFLGFQPHIGLVITAVNVVMHSSRYEGMGRTICEALLCGRPVAGTAVDGVREVIISGERGGILVPPEQPSALADATLTLLRDSHLARELAASGRQWVLDNLSADTMVGRIRDAYESGLEISRRAPSNKPD